MRMMSQQCQECSVHSSKPISFFLVTSLAVCTITWQYASVMCNYNCMFLFFLTLQDSCFVLFIFTGIAVFVV